MRVWGSKYFQLGKLKNLHSYIDLDSVFYVCNLITFHCQTHIFTEIISSMGDAQSIPVVGEVVTAAQSTTKIVAAGACALVGKDEAADRFFEG